MSRVVQKNTALPVTTTEVFTTVFDFQREVRVLVYREESCLSKKNLLLREFLIKDIQRAPRDVPKIHITFTINFDVILTVTACNKETQSTNNIVITGYRSWLSRDQIWKMIEDAKALNVQDDLMRLQYHSELDFEAQPQPEAATSSQQPCQSYKAILR
ncbi:Heat shock- 70 kDa protein 2 [Entomophthora muscae]|uniref:Heat shock- 70 kDa protein 2 n=1 Tax=Entomophthora muscae TaxID=34485 RepID=A0ACC2RKD2_9FUNG|nr:Heat shock- 70 kDa protein 2 [Entomophthora muscae]